MSVGASAATVVARMLYHLWSGPLLGGPSLVRRVMFFLLIVHIILFCPYFADRTHKARICFNLTSSRLPYVMLRGSFVPVSHLCVTTT
jgi:hypothetical protein